MKITCNSCGSKYTIADAKVEGKKVKVRCKGCKESILVDGTKIGQDEPDDNAGDVAAAPISSPPSSADLAAPVAAAPVSKPSVWSVNISDDDSREMNLEELVQGWKDGVVTPDAYVWKDGMGDWKPILEVGELKHRLGSLPTGQPAPAAAAATQPGEVDLFGAAAASGSVAEKKAAPLGTGEAKPTGARNDSSVLFSLDSITGGDAPGQVRANADDIFAGLGSTGGSLGSNTDLLMAPAKNPPPAPAGAHPPGAEAPKAKSSGKGGLIGALLGAAVIVGGGLFFMSGTGASPSSEADAKLAAAEAKITAAEKKAAEATKKADSDRSKMEADLKKAREGAEKKGDDPNAAAAEKKAELEKAKSGSTEKKEASKPSSASSSSGSAKASAKPAASTAAPAFSVSAAKSSLTAAAGRAASCKKPGGPTGSGKVQVTFSTSGRVTSSRVISGPFGGTAVGGCVASTFRRARVPKFSGSPKTVKKSFRIR